MTQPTETPSVTSQLWDQQPNETQNAYALFLDYLEFGPDPDFSGLAEKTGKSISALWTLSSRHHWSERAAARRQHLARLAFEAAQRVAQDQAAFWAARMNVSREQEWENGQLLAQLGRRLTHERIHNPASTTQGYELKSVFETASKLCRLAAENDRPTEPVSPIRSLLEEELELAYGRGKDAVPSVPDQNSQPSTLNLPVSPSPSGGEGRGEVDLPDSQPSTINNQLL